MSLNHLSVTELMFDLAQYRMPSEFFQVASGSLCVHTEMVFMGSAWEQARNTLALSSELSSRLQERKWYY